jgi:hypothetical protein
MGDELFRRACDCGAPVTWFDAEAVRKDAELSALAVQAAAFMGERIESVWRCTRPACGASGFFGSMHMSF